MENTNDKSKGKIKMAILTAGGGVFISKEKSDYSKESGDAREKI